MTKIAMNFGATHGIGLAIASELRASGYALSLGMRRPQAVAALFAHDDALDEMFDINCRYEHTP